MQFKVALFAYQKEQHGSAIELDSEPTVEAVLRALADRGVRVEHCRLAVNEELATETTPVTPNARLALIPPVSGG